MPTIPRESTEYVYLNVTRNGAPVTDGVRATITSADSRPTDSGWTDTTIVDGKVALLVTHQLPGRYRVWVNVTNGPESIVESAGSLIVS